MVFNDTNNQNAYSDETEQLIQQRKIQFWIDNNVPLPQQMTNQQTNQSYAKAPNQVQA